MHSVLTCKMQKTGRVETRLTWSAGDPGSFSPPLSANPRLFWMPKMTCELMDRASAFSPLVSKERLLSPFSFLLSLFRSPLFLLVFCTFFSSFCRPKVSPCFCLVSPLFFSSFLFSSFSSTACLPDLTATQGWRKKLPLFYAFFSLLTAYLSCVFCLSFSVFLCSLLSFSAWLPFFFFRLFFLS